MATSQISAFTTWEMSNYENVFVAKGYRAHRPLPYVKAPLMFLFTMNHLCLSIGVDDVFVFINTYRQAEHIKDPRHRMIHTIQTAGKATFFTSLTTASAYAANIFSQVRSRDISSGLGLTLVFLLRRPF